MYTEPRIAPETADSAAPAGDDAAVPPVALKQGEPAKKQPRILEEVVVEEVSIDGMCGVY